MHPKAGVFRIGVALCCALVALAHGTALAQYGPDTSPAKPERDQTVTLSPGFGPSTQVFLMPTANPIGSGKGFIGNYELGLMYGGVGIGDYVSVMGGASVVPFLNASNQLYTAQLKISTGQSGAFNFALGGSAAWLTSYNFLAHIFAAATLLYDTTWWVTGMVYYKVVGGDFVDIPLPHYGDFAFPYTNPLGFAIGLETRPSGRSDMRIVGEVWLSGSAVFLWGIRFGNEWIEDTFGFIVAATPLPVPVTSFVVRW